MFENVISEMAAICSRPQCVNAYDFTRDVLCMETQPTFTILPNEQIQPDAVSDISVWNKIPDSKVHGANMGPTWVLSAPDGPGVGPMNLAIRDVYLQPSAFLTI